MFCSLAHTLILTFIKTGYDRSLRLILSLIRTQVLSKMLYEFTTIGNRIDLSSLTPKDNGRGSHRQDLVIYCVFARLA